MRHYFSSNNVRLLAASLHMETQSPNDRSLKNQEEYSRPWVSRGFVFRIRPDLWLISFDRYIDKFLGNANF